MTHKLLIFAGIGLALVLGVIAGQSIRSPSATLPTGSSTEREVLYWVAPMDPNYRRDEPGQSPMGMDLLPVYADELDARPGVVKIDPIIVNNLGVRTAKAERSELMRRIDTVGYVRFDEETVQHLHTRVDGWVEKLVTKSSGDPVTRGQLLFELYSPTLVNAQEELLTAARSGNTLLLKASRDRLAALGVSEGDIKRLERERKVEQRVRVFAETDGVIAHLGVREGIYVTPATEVMSVAKLDQVWIVAEVLERQASWVKPGLAATVELDALPGRTLQGSIDYVYPELDPVTRTLKLRMRFENPDLLLRPNMFARVSIDAEGFGSVVHVPREAVIRDSSMDRVVIAMGEGRFRSKTVRLGIESGDRIAIRQGLDEGEEVVVSAQFLIDSESNIETALRRMNDQTESKPADVAPATPGMDHSGHDMTSEEGDDMTDHSGHDMTSEEGDDMTDHSGHDMSDQNDHETMDHSDHDMESMQ